MDLTSELHQLDMEHNVNPGSRSYSKRTINTVKQILKNFSIILEQEETLKDLEENIHAILLYNAPNTEFERISRVWADIQFFYESCRTDPIISVELICNVVPKSASMLSLHDICKCNAIFVTQFGIFRLEDLGPSNFQVFAIAEAFAKAKYNNNKELAIKDFVQVS